MPSITSPVDGARIYYTDYRHPTSKTSETKPFVPLSPLTPTPTLSLPQSFTLLFIHGWPMSSEMYTSLMLPFSQNHNIRCIAPDRRGFGRSEWSGNGGTGEDVTYETFAKDTLAVVEAARIEGPWAVVGASMGCGESLLLYEVLSERLRKSCTGFIWLGPSLPFPLQCESNPTAPPRELWDSILQGLRDDRVGFVKVAIHGVFGTRSVEEGGAGIELPPSKIEFFEHVVRQADALAIERCPMIITGRDFSDKLKKVDRKVLVIHGDSDQGMPASASAYLIEKLIPDGLCQVNMYEKAAHGLYLTHAGKVMGDILAFISAASTH